MGAHTYRKYENPRTAIERICISLIGPPGSGKGTHAGPLSKMSKLPHISTGDLLRKHMHEQTPHGLQVKKYLEMGILVPEKLILDILNNRLLESDCDRGAILDGFPRNLAQAEELRKGQGPLKTRIYAFYFDLPDSSVVERIKRRIACYGCGHTYDTVYNRPKNGNCDECGGKLYQREDDVEEITVQKRLQTYHKETEPLIEYYDRLGCMYRLKADKEKTQIFKDVTDLFNGLPRRD